MKNFINKLTAPLGIIQIIAKYEPMYLFWSLPQIILNAVLPLLYVYAPKLIIGKLTDGSPYKDVICVILVYCGILLILNIANKYLSGKSGFAADRFTKKLRFEIGKTVMRLDIGDMESASQRNIVGMANNAANLTDTLAITQQMISNIITVIGLAAMVASLDIVFFFAIAIVLCFKSFFTYIRYAYDKKMREPRQKNQLVGAYLSGLAYFNHGAEKEIRVNNLQEWFLGKVKGYRRDMLEWQYHDFRMYALFDCIMAILTAAESFLVLYLLSDKYMEGLISIADFTMYFSAVITITAALSSFAEQIGQYNKQLLNVWDYKKLMRLSGSHCITSNIPAGVSESVEIIFDDVSFAYPGCEKYTLAHINLTIKDREKLVVVGLNGAGKTTLIKLLCKFYRPSSGKITCNGTDIWGIPNNEYYRLIAAVFQDYTNFAFTLAENISVSEKCDVGKAGAILRELGLDRLITSLPDGLETCLSKNFSETGVELSGGEGQKLAIARAIYKDAPLLILDEPTASLDAKAESEIYEDLFRMSKDKTTIFISHRLAASTIADRIIVFDGGQIVESGAHEELLRKNGLYAEMYMKQSRPYVTDTSG
jgi:ATP-binding cassette subfamily B protein